MRVSYVGNRLDFQTGIFIKKESWDNVQQRVLPINSSIAIANDLNDHLLKCFQIWLLFSVNLN